MTYVLYIIFYYTLWLFYKEIFFLKKKEKKHSKLWLTEYKVKPKNWDKKFVFALLPFFFLERIFHFIRHFESKKIHLVIIYHSFMSFLSVNVIYSFIQKGKWYNPILPKYCRSIFILHCYHFNYLVDKIWLWIWLYLIAPLKTLTWINILKF